MGVLLQSELKINIKHSDFVLKRFLLGRNGQDFDQNIEIQMLI